MSIYNYVDIDKYVVCSNKYVDITMLHVPINELHVNIIKLHADINRKTDIEINKSHVDIII